MKMPTIVDIFIFISRENFILSYVKQERSYIYFSNLRFISMKNFMLSWVEHEKSFITSGPEKTQADLVISAVSSKPLLFADIYLRLWGSFRQKTNVYSFQNRGLFMHIQRPTNRQNYNVPFVHVQANICMAILQGYCTHIGECGPEWGYRRTQSCERPYISQRETIYTIISAITLLLYSYKYCSLVLLLLLNFCLIWRCK